MTTTFEIIQRNQMIFICATAIILSILTGVVSILLDQEIRLAANQVSFMNYQLGFKHAHVKAAMATLEDFTREFSVLHDILGVLRISVLAAVAASVTHFGSSLWTLYKKSLMSRVVWLVSQGIALILLVTACTLPYIKYSLQGPLILNVFYAVTSVDSFVTLLLIVVSYFDYRSMSSSSGSDPEAASDTDRIEMGSPAPEAGDNDPLPPAPPPPLESSTTTTTTTTTSSEPSPSPATHEELPPPPPPPTTAS